MASGGPQPNAFYCRAQGFFDEIRTGASESRSNFLKEWAVASLLTLVSVASILRAKAMGIRVVHYLIDIDNGEEVYDKRSGYVLEELPPGETLNFFHVNRPRNVFATWGQRAHPVYFESLWRVAGLFWPGQKSDGSEAVKFNNDRLGTRVARRLTESERQASFWQWLFNWLGVERFYCIDDPRHTGELRLACQREGILTLAYMHARFNKYHVGLCRPRFDRYLVWAPMWRDLLKRMNTEYEDSTIIVSGHPRLSCLQRVDRSIQPVRILWLGETNVDANELASYVSALNQLKGIEVIYRAKWGSSQGDEIPWVGCDKWGLDLSPDFIQSLHNNRISLVLGTHSTALIESWVCGVPSLMLSSSNDYAWHLTEEGFIPGCSSEEDLPKAIKQVNTLSDAEIQTISEKMWGRNPTWEKTAMREWLNQ